MKLAAIDIGSNAIRLQISTVLDREPKALFKKLEYVRFPLRLGHDVFTDNRISPASMKKFKKLMLTYKMLLDLYEVNDYMFCATSAMRESENGAQLAQEVYDEMGITINIIDGMQEAEFINRALHTFLDNQSYLHIDVGGGSTELNVYTDGKKIKSRSFKIGSVRILEHHDAPEVWKDMEHWVKENCRGIKHPFRAIGTGGNISKLFELAQKKQGQTMSMKKVLEWKDKIEKATIDERIYVMLMNPDRADVIVPATTIYIRVMEWAGIKKVIVPDIGLKDGILYHLLEKNKHLLKFAF